jgi:hypothetical protein
MNNSNGVSQHHKDQLLDALFYRLTPEQRAELAREVPVAYNAYVGRTAAIVTWADGRKM